MRASLRQDLGGIPALGPRGEGWVLIQTILLVGIVVAGVVGARWPENLLVPALVIAIISGAAGLWLAVSAIGTLGKSVSPFPKPPATAELKESGVYGLVRHPIYGGILMMSLAWSLALSPWALIPTGALAIVKGTKNSDHARDLPFHESVLVQHSGGEAVSMFPARSGSDIR